MKKFNVSMTFTILLLIPLAYGQTETLSNSAALTSQKRQLQGFPNVRNEILNLIGSSQRRVWLFSEYLSDGEIIAALYVALYRKLDVQVLLGRQKANHYMSRLYDLKKQNIPVFLKPDQFAIKSTSVIISDDTLNLIDGELNFLAKYQLFNLEVIQGPRVNDYAQVFIDATQKAIPAVAKPLPLVGKARPQKTTAIPSAPPVHYQGEKDGSFNYDAVSKHQRTIPEGHAKRLPKEPLYQTLEKQRQKVGDDSTQDQFIENSIIENNSNEVPTQMDNGDKT